MLMLTHIHNTESEVKFISNKLQGIQMWEACKRWQWCDAMLGNSTHILI